MYLASIFGSQELHLADGELIAIVLIIQLIAVLGAWLFTKISARIGSIRTLYLGVVLCILVCLGAYFTTTATEFYILAVLVGFVMGGMQSMSRATYSKLLPETNDHASYFSFYEFTEKTGIVLGTATFGLITDISRHITANGQPNMRYSLFALIGYFLIGLLFLTRLLKRQASSSRSLIGFLAEKF